MLEFDEHRYATAEAMLDALNPARWSEPHSTSILWYFRGQADSTWNLRPSVWRSSLDRDAVAFQQLAQRYRTEYAATLDHVYSCHILPYQDDHERYPVNRIYDVLVHALTEYRTIRDFIEFADELGILPFYDKQFMFEPAQFIRLYARSLFRENTNTFSKRIWSSPFVVLAQHHGIPTRLLDWTRNPITAGYFATEGADESEGDIAIYAVPFDVFRSKRFMECQVPNYGNSYLATQHGLLVLDMLGDRYYLEHGEWPHFEQSYQYQNPYQRLTPIKLVLPRAEKQELERLLWLGRVTRAHLMPTLDNAAIAQKAKWRLSNALNQS